MFILITPIWRFLFLENSKAFCYPLFPFFKGFHRFWQTQRILTTMFWSNCRCVSGLSINPPHQRLEKQIHLLTNPSKTDLGKRKTLASKSSYQHRWLMLPHGAVPFDKDGHEGETMLVKGHAPETRQLWAHRTVMRMHRREELHWVLTVFWRWEDNYFLSSTC